MIISEKISGTQIAVEIQSSNLKQAIYDTVGKKLVLVFNNNKKYEYDEVPWDVFAAFRLAESQGKYFNSNINKKYIYKLIQVEDDSSGTNQ
jgi:hypothetical protein